MPRRIARRPFSTPLQRLVAFQVAVVSSVLLYLLTGGAWLPDHGLQQLDAITLDEAVPGVTAAQGRPTLVLAAGLQTNAGCRRDLRRYLSQRDTPHGLSARFGLLVLAPPTDMPAAMDAVFLPDPDGTMARALALPRATASCHPGYALLDRGGMLRYRSYDSGYAEHVFEQTVLLEHLS